MTTKLSIIIPTKNASQHLTHTIESLISQEKCDFEAIFIDAESRDGTLEFIASYTDTRLRVQSVPEEASLFEMINRGIKLATGEYVQILLPGDNFLFVDAIATALWQLESHAFPNLFYTACFVQDDAKASRFFFRSLQKEQLAKGNQPTVLQACFIKKSCLQTLGYFNSKYKRRAAFDFFCRFLLKSEYRFASEMRVYVDLKPLVMDARFLVENMKESYQIIRVYFGLMKACQYLWRQKDLKRLWMRAKRRFRLAFQR